MVSDLIHGFHLGVWLVRFKACLRVSVSVFGVNMDLLELYEQEVFIPVILSLIHKEPKVLLKLLADTFCLAISLQVVHSSCGKPNPEHVVQFTG